MYFLDKFSELVKICGDAPALTDSDGKRTLSYRQLDELSVQIACKLKKSGVGKGSRVIIVLDRCVEYVATEIALLKLRAVIVPLIPSYPKERIEYIKSDCNVSCIVTKNFIDDIKDVSLCECTTCENFSDEDTAMLIYTSGSTGNPKGVVYSAGNLDAQIIRKSQCVEDIKPLIFAASATMSFCVTVTEYLRTLAVGGHIHMISEEVRSDVKRLSDYYTENHITSGYISPRILKMFDCNSDDLKRVFTAGEKVVNLYSDKYEIVNCYGQSESVGAITEFVIDKQYDNTPIGKPVSGLEIIIMDKDGKEVKDGEEGQICIIGNLPCEYNNLPEQSKKTFRKLSDGRTFIYTGDIGKKLSDENIVYLNRMDWMIKVHGQRVEPGEIEGVMNTVDGVTGSIVKAFEKEDSTMILCGFYTESHPVDKNIIRKELEKKLPHYMIPGVYVKLDSFPVNANGKIDRKSIAMPDFSEARAEYEAPENEIEEIICYAMQKVLGIDKIGRNDNFIELGGNSINAVTLCEKCGIKGLAPQLVMIGQTPCKISELLEKSDFCIKPEIEICGKIKDEYPLSMAQKYQLDVCNAYNTPIDVIDMTYYFKLDADVDVKRLICAIEKVVNAHPIYKCHVDTKNNRLITDAGEFTVKEIFVKASEFEDYRISRYKKVRNILTDPLIDAEILHIDDGGIYLYLCLCHMVYDGETLRILLNEISAEYDGKEGEEEKASIFDMIDYEEKLRCDNQLTDSAWKAFDDNYMDLSCGQLFKEDDHFETAYSMQILTGIREEKINEFLRTNNISILTLIEAAMEKTIEKKFGVSDFCYMNVYNGRCDHRLANSHGVFAKSVFMRSSVKDCHEAKKLFKEIENQYQRLVYFDVLDTFDVVEKYPAIRSGITLNYRDFLTLSIDLGGKTYIGDFLYEPYEINKPFTDFDFIVNKMPKGYGYNVVLSSAKVTGDFAKAFAEKFDAIMCEIINSNDVPV